ncbi:MAG: penicillin-binding protein 2 [Cyanothece sp. SIO1E1]|nr:penicillin-binding protein 2 [Cyanothece sp. SIO1E1]
MATGLFSSSIASSRVNGSLLDNSTSRRSLFYRSLLLMFLTTAVLGVFTLRLAQLQLVQGAYNQKLADQNRIRMLPMPAERGNITDRQGRLLATNRLSRSVYLWPRQQSPEQWPETIAKLAQLLDIPADDILQQLARVGYHSALPIRITQNLSSADFIKLAEQLGQFSGVDIQAESSRHYPHGGLAAHVLGYIGEATLADLEERPDYPMGMIVGQLGIEKIANAQLEGKWGDRLVEVDARGQELRWLGARPPEAGSAVKLTLDLDLQKAAEQTLNQRRGAAVALDVKTGAILALASGPSFDPNIFTRRVTQSDWQKLQAKQNPFLNRALQGYPPGSTFKIVTSTAGIQSGKFKPDAKIGTSAAITLGGFSFHEHSGHGYGVIGFREALAYSSNTFFYRVGLKSGPEAIAKWGKVLGVGTAADLGLAGASPGVIPTPQQKQELYDEPWYAGDTVSMSIGQGVVQVAPLELAVMVATIANGGQRVKPHLLATETNTSATKPEATGIDPGAIKAIQAGLVAAVEQGTARRLNDGSIPLTGGKTGTAEVLGQKSHSVFVGFGPANDPQIAVAAIVENGGFGSRAALPIAHEVYKAYFKQD